MSGIVISYRREDTEGSAGRLYDRLVPRYGDEFVFMDFYSIESGEDWLAKIDETVASSDVMLAIIGPRWSTAADDAGRRRLEDERDYVRREILTALKHNVRVLPVLVQMPEWWLWSHCRPNWRQLPTTRRSRWTASTTTVTSSGCSAS